MVFCVVDREVANMFGAVPWADACCDGYGALGGY